MWRYIRPKAYIYMIGEVETTRTSFLLEEEMAFPQTEGTFAFTINTFGPSAGRISLCLSVCLSCRSKCAMKAGVRRSDFQNDWN